jgi:hypothetical protein
MINKIWTELQKTLMVVNELYHDLVRNSVAMVGARPLFSTNTAGDLHASSTEDEIQTLITHPAQASAQLTMQLGRPLTLPLEPASNNQSRAPDPIEWVVVQSLQFTRVLFLY